MRMKIIVEKAMMGGTYNNQLKASVEEMAMAAAMAMATEREMVTATRQRQ
jgi:hypothetical protein